MPAPRPPLAVHLSPHRVDGHALLSVSTGPGPGCGGLLQLPIEALAALAPAIAEAVARFHAEQAR